MKYGYLLVLLFIASCANNSNINKAIGGLQSNSDITPYIKVLEQDKAKSKNYLLSQQELGRINFILNKPNQSLVNFNNVINFYNYQEELGLQVGKLTKSALASTILDDNALAYLGSDFERAMVHFYNALNYLKLNNFNAALVELRASYDIQKLAIAKREKEVDKAYKELSKYEISKELKNELATNNNIIANTKNKFLNSYIYYVSGAIKEANNELNSALIDYKNALELYPNNTFLLQHVLRLSAIYDSSYYLNLLAKHKDLSFTTQKDYNKQTTVTIIYEQGFVPQKTSKKFTVVVANTVVSIALPSYSASNINLSKVDVQYNSTSTSMQEIGNIYSLAKFDLSEHYPAILVRQLLRTTSKIALQSTANKDNIDPTIAISLFLVGAVASAAETADIRSFSTLPAAIQTASFSTTEKLDNIIIKVNKSKDLNIPINSNSPENLLILVLDTGNAMYYNILLRTKKFIN